MGKSERLKAIEAAINRWLSDDRGADYGDLARMIDDALVEPEETTEGSSVVLPAEEREALLWETRDEALALLEDNFADVLRRARAALEGKRGGDE